jgi:hypothetical protein
MPHPRRPLPEDTVEKVAAWFFQFARKKIDRSDRPAKRSRTPVKGKKTPETLAAETDRDFFNSIRAQRPLACAEGNPFRGHGHLPFGHRSTELKRFRIRRAVRS